MLAPIVRGRKGEFKKELAALRARGFTKVRVDGQLRSLDDDIKLDRRRNHTIDVVVDRLILKPGIERRLTESVEVALNLADDIVVINTLDGGDRLFSRRLACTYCGVSMPEMTPRAFSFNSPHGACPECQGLGAVYDFDPARLVPDESLSLQDGAIAPWARATRSSCKEALASLGSSSASISRSPFRRLPKKLRDVLLLRREEGRAARRQERGRKKTKDGRRGSVRRRLRRAGPEPAPPLRRGHLGRAGEPRAVSRAAPVPVVPGRAAEAAEPRRPRQGAHRSPSTSTCRSPKRSRSSTSSS